MMEAVQTSETSVNLHRSTRRYNPEDRRLRSCIFFAVGHVNVSWDRIFFGR
jgi:hypothetical protein